MAPWNWPEGSRRRRGTQSESNPLSLDVIGAQFTDDKAKIELAHVRFFQEDPSNPLQMHVLHHAEMATPENLKHDIEALESEGPQSLRQINITNKKVGDSTAKAAYQFARQNRFSLDEDVDLIGSSGCLVDDTPIEQNRASYFEGDAEPVELGDISTVAAKTNKTTVGDFVKSAAASHLPPDPMSINISDLLGSQAEVDSVLNDAKGPLGIAFAALENWLGRPLSASDEDDNERLALIGHLQSGDNYFDLRKKAVEFWGGCSADAVGPTRELVAECEC